MNKEILKSLDALNETLEKRFGDLERRVTELEKVNKGVIGTQRCLAKNMKTLTEVVKNLAESDAVWKSKNGAAIAINDQKASEAFYDLGMTDFEALTALRDMDVLVTDKGRLRKKVRIPPDGKTENHIVVRVIKL